MASGEKRTRMTRYVHWILTTSNRSNNIKNQFVSDLKELSMRKSILVLTAFLLCFSLLFLQTGCGPATPRHPANELQAMVDISLAKPDTCFSAGGCAQSSEETGKAITAFFEKGMKLSKISFVKPSKHEVKGPQGLKTIYAPGQRCTLFSFEKTQYPACYQLSTSPDGNPEKHLGNNTVFVLVGKKDTYKCVNKRIQRFELVTKNTTSGKVTSRVTIGRWKEGSNFCHAFLDSASDTCAKKCYSTATEARDLLAEIVILARNAVALSAGESVESYARIVLNSPTITAALNQ